jgi:hypothetical protein
MNKTLLKFFVGLVALSLAVCAAFFSIAGLSKLFAGASIAVIAMAVTLEASKLVIASFLYRTWSTVNKILRVYLIGAVVIIALITSIGIYGFLSAAYQNTKAEYELSATASDSLSIKQTYYDNAVAAFKIQLESKNNQLQTLSNIRTSQEQRAASLVSNNKSSKSTDKFAARTDSDIKAINTEITKLNDSIIKFSTESARLKLSATQSKLQNEANSELGSLTFISKVTGLEMDTVVNILIILFMIVFDPLAICMVLAFNQLNIKDEQKQHLIDIMNSDEELGLYEPGPVNLIEDIIVNEPELVQPEQVTNNLVEEPTETGLDSSIIDNVDNDIIEEVITEEREDIYGESEEQKETNRREREKQKRLQASIGGATK